MQILTLTSNCQALDLAYHGNTLLSQDIGSAVGGNVLLFGDRNDVSHRFVNVRNLLHSTLTVETTRVQAIHATNYSTSADNIIWCIQNILLGEQVTMPFLG